MILVQLGLESLINWLQLMYVCINVCVYKCMYVCTYVCTVCMYVQYLCIT